MATKRGLHGRVSFTSSEDEEDDYSKRRAKERAEQLIKEAEQLKASIIRPSGKSKRMSYRDESFNRFKVFQCDKAYFHNTSHIDKATKDKIKKAEFVELEKLLPKERFRRKQRDDRMELVRKEDE